MKLAVYVSLFTAISFSNCSKPVKDKTTSGDAHQRPAGFTEDKIVAVNNCSQFVQNSINYSICLDSVINESRCPQGVQCVWQGFARAKFSFTAGLLTHHFSLCTLINTGSTQFPNDTTINGIKIQFKDLTPYPSAPTPTNYNDYKAEVLITGQ